MTYQADNSEELLVHDWRVDRLTRLGVPGSLAEVYADQTERDHTALADAAASGRVQAQEGI